jgi:ABC-type nickel/cobalt efflux system permease component RcnA
VSKKPSKAHHGIGASFSKALSQLITAFVWIVAVIVVFILWRWQAGDIWAAQLIYKAFSTLIVLVLFGTAISMVAKALGGGRR